MIFFHTVCFEDFKAAGTWMFFSQINGNFRKNSTKCSSFPFQNTGICCGSCASFQKIRSYLFYKHRLSCSRGGSIRFMNSNKILSLKLMDWIVWKRHLEENYLWRIEFVDSNLFRQKWKIGKRNVDAKCQKKYIFTDFYSIETDLRAFYLTTKQSKSKQRALDVSVVGWSEKNSNT